MGGGWSGSVRVMLCFPSGFFHTVLVTTVSPIFPFSLSVSCRRYTPMIESQCMTAQFRISAVNILGVFCCLPRPKDPDFVFWLFPHLGGIGAVCKTNTEQFQISAVVFSWCTVVCHGRNAQILCFGCFLASTVELMPFRNKDRVVHSESRQ